MSFALRWKLEPPQPHRKTSKRVTPAAHEMNNTEKQLNFSYFIKFAVKRKCEILLYLLSKNVNMKFIQLLTFQLFIPV